MCDENTDKRLSHKKLVIFETLPEIDKLDTKSTTMKEYFTFIANFFTPSLICLFCRSLSSF